MLFSNTCGKGSKNSWFFRSPSKNIDKQHSCFSLIYLSFLFHGVFQASSYPHSLVVPLLSLVWTLAPPPSHPHIQQVLNPQSLVVPKEFKRGIRSLFDPCVNAMGRRPYCPSHMEVSYCTFGFGAIIRCNLHTLPLSHDSRICIGDLSPRRKGSSHLTKLFGGLSYEKILRYNNSPPYMMARWLPQKIPPLNFLGRPSPLSGLDPCTFPPPPILIHTSNKYLPRQFGCPSPLPDLVPLISSPFSSTHQQYPVLAWHCIAS